MADRDDSFRRFWRLQRPQPVVFITDGDPIDGIRMGCAAFALVHHPQKFAGAAKDKTKDRCKI
jgi:hypothetical protein